MSSLSKKKYLWFTTNLDQLGSREMGWKLGIAFKVSKNNGSINRELSVADPDSGPEIRNPGPMDPGLKKIRTRDPRSETNTWKIFREPSNRFFLFKNTKNFVNSILRIRIRCLLDPGSGFGRKTNIRSQQSLPGSQTGRSPAPTLPWGQWASVRYTSFAGGRGSCGFQEHSVSCE